MRGFVRFYEFLLQASCFKDIDIHKKYVFIGYLLSYLDIAGGGSGFDLTGKIKASQFVQKKGDTHSGEKLVSKPVMKLPESDGLNLSETKKERLQKIIDLQLVITQAEMEKQVGKTITVLADKTTLENPNELLGKTERDERVAKYAAWGEALRG